MTTLEKLQFCKEHGISINYIAELTELNAATLTKWLRGQKGITKKNERHVELTIQKLAKEIWLNVGDNHDGNI